VDGGQHAERFEKDEARTAYLESKGYTVMRFWNHEVLRETEAVLERILNMISSDSPLTLSLSPKGRGNVVNNCRKLNLGPCPSDPMRFGQVRRDVQSAETFFEH
jgi:hypothetical protein